MEVGRDVPIAPPGLCARVMATGLRKGTRARGGSVPHGDARGSTKTLTKRWLLRQETKVMCFVDEMGGICYSTDMKKNLPFVILSVLLVILDFGCISSKPRNAPRKNRLLSSENTDYGIIVDVYAGNRLELFRRPIEREELADRIKRECSGRGYQRVVVVCAKDPSVHKSDLTDLREELVRAGIPRVVLRTARNVYSEAPQEDYELIESLLQKGEKSVSGGQKGAKRK